MSHVNDDEKHNKKFKKKNVSNTLIRKKTQSRETL